MLIDREKRSGDKELDKYIQELEDELTSISTSGINKLIIAADMFSQQLAADFLLVAAGKHKDELGVLDKSKLNILNDDKSDCLYERMMVTVSKIKDFAAVSDLAKEIRPKVKNEIVEESIKIEAEATIPAIEKLQRRKI